MSCAFVAVFHPPSKTGEKALKIPWGKPCAGSSPAVRTNKIKQRLKSVADLVHCVRKMPEPRRFPPPRSVDTREAGGGTPQPFVA
jgi:hypothetical protein